MTSFGTLVRRALAAAALALSATDVAAAPAATALAASEAEGATVVTLSLDAPATADAYLLDAPPRLVADLPRLDWRIGAPRPVGLAAGFRWGLATPSASRLVVDLAGPARLESVSASADGRELSFRLVAAPRMEGARGPAPATAAGPPAVVALDAGHGGKDPGAIRRGIAEKDLTLAMARIVAAALRERGLAVVLTREDDRFLPLSARVARARAAGADLFLSLHADALAEGVASGASVYVHGEAPSDAQAAALAERENDAPSVRLPGGGALAAAGADVASALVDLARPVAAAESRRLGEALVAALRDRVAVHTARPLREADFRVLAAPEIPAALVEMGFLSTEEDLLRLRDPRWRAALAEAVAEGVAAWAEARPDAPRPSP